MSRLSRDFGIRLRQIRQSRNLTQEQLAEKLDVSVNFLQMIEHGKRAPSFVTLERMIRVLRTPAAEFFTLNPESKAPKS